MVRPDESNHRCLSLARFGSRCIEPAGGSPVPVGTGAPGSRPRAGGEILLVRAGCHKPLWREQARGPQLGVNAAASTEEQWESRAAHVTAKATDSILDLSGVPGGDTLGQNNAEQERPSPAGMSGTDRPYKAGRPKSRGAGRESEGSTLPVKACSKTRCREGLCQEDA